MSDDVFISGWLQDITLGSKLGLRWKFPGEDWSGARHELAVLSQDQLNRRNNRYKDGHRLAEGDVPEALAIWEPKCFARKGDMFSIGSMYIVQPRLAEVFSRFDLGEGCLTPATIYQADLQTPAVGEYWMLHFGARKDCFLPEQSNQEDYRITKMYVDRASGRQIWKAGFGVKDGDVALSSAALQGADLWCEEGIWARIFMSGALAEALQKAKPKKVDFDLRRCRVIGQAL